MSSAAGILELRSGKWIDILNPDPESILLSDIASGLSKMCRFHGQTKEFYSVAEHSVLCALLAAENGGTPETVKAALLHDAHEAYLGDIPTPIKQVITGWESIAEGLDRAIAEALGVDASLFSSPEVQKVDRQALSLEAHRFMSLTTPGFKEGLIPLAELPEEIGDEQLGYHWPQCPDPESLFLSIGARLDRPNF